MPLQKTFGLKVLLEDTGEIFHMHNCHDDMTIGEMKSMLELVAGIPTNLQRLFYIDEGDLPDNVTLQFNGIIKNATIRMKSWFQDGWAKLLHAAAHGDIEELVSLGVTKDSDYSTPNSRRMNAVQKAAWIAERASVALFIAAHRGHIDIVNFLLTNGANPKTKTIDGHTALHMAVIMAKAECINYLLLHGAEAEGTDSKGRTLMDLAQMTQHPENVGKIFQFQWMKRTAGMPPLRLMNKSDLFAHQRFDSTLKTWRSGPQSKLYMANLLKPGEPRGTHVVARKGPALNQARKNRPTSSAGPTKRRVSSKWTRKHNPGPAQAGKPPAQPQDAWQEEATGTKVHRSSNGAHRPDALPPLAKSAPLAAADHDHKPPTGSREATRPGAGKPGAGRKK